MLAHNCLGLGFSMGLEKLASELLKGMLGTPPVQFKEADLKKYGVSLRDFVRREDGRIDWWRLRRLYRLPKRVSFRAMVIHAAVAARFLRAYRERNSKIAGSWRAFNDALPLMADPRGAFGVVRKKVGPVEIMREAIRKPSGLILRYDGLRAREREDGSVSYSYTDGREWKHVYGGLLVENVVQSIARDIVLEQMLAVRAEGYRIVTTTHDEIVALCPERSAPECLRRMLEIMRTPPDWCRDLPLNASGSFAKNYGACK